MKSIFNLIGLLFGIIITIKAVPNNHAELEHRMLRVEERNYYISFNIEMTLQNFTFVYNNNFYKNSQVIADAIFDTLSLSGDSFVTQVDTSSNRKLQQVGPWSDQTYNVFAYLSDTTSNDGLSTNTTEASLRTYSNLTEHFIASSIDGSFAATLRQYGADANRVDFANVYVVNDISFNSYVADVKLKICNQYCMVNPGVAVGYAILGIAFFIGVFCVIRSLCACKDQKEREFKHQQMRQNAIHAADGSVGDGAVNPSNVPNKMTTVIPERSGSMDNDSSVPTRDVEMSPKNKDLNKENELGF